MYSTIILLNDKKAYNKRYRAYLEQQLKSQYSPQFISCGLFDSIISPLKLLKYQLFGAITVSSNLKSNLFTLLVGASGPLILNGLGRHEDSVIFRFIFLCLARFRKNKKVFFVQRYRDYLWLRKQVPGILVKWMPGSGAEPLPVTNSETPGTYVVISRAEKLKVIESQILTAASKLGVQELLIYGVNTDYQFHIQPSFKVHFMGYVEPSEFFLKCKNFLQVGGYGEGFPHTLAYALCSNTYIIIDKQLSRSLGIYRLPVKRSTVAEGFESLKPLPEITSLLSENSVYQGILDQVGAMIKHK